MRPVVDLPDPQLLHRTEPPQVHPRVLHEADRRRVDEPSAVRVEQHPHPDTGLGSGGERLGQMGPDLALPVDEGEEVDRVVGAVDRVEQGREDLVTVAKHVDAVALGGGHSEDSLERPANLRRPVVLGCHADRRLPTSTRAGAALGSDSATLSASCGAEAWARTASSCAAMAAPRNTAMDGEERPEEQRDHPRQRTVGLAERRAVGEEHPHAEGDDAPERNGHGGTERQPRPGRLPAARAEAEEQRHARERQADAHRPRGDVGCTSPERAVDRAAQRPPERQQPDRHREERTDAHREERRRVRTSAAPADPAPRRRSG